MTTPRIMICGSTGMLGSYMWRYLNREFECTRLDRDQVDVCEITGFQNQFLLDVLVEQHTHVINCVGVLKPNIKHVGVDNTVLINTVWPQMLQQSCVKHDTRLIHISSDCVFSGRAGNYVETDTPDGLDLYARTKSLEPQGACVIRTSFVGDDTRRQGRGLLQWVLRQTDTMPGYVNCLWNGVTCLELCEQITRMIKTDRLWSGVRHMFSNQVISKYQLCKHIVECYGKHIEVVKTRADMIEGTVVDDVLDRSLRTVHEDAPIVTNDIASMLEYQRSFDQLS